MTQPPLRCDHCQAPFTPVGEQAALFAHARATGMQRVMLECPHCFHGTLVNPCPSTAVRATPPDAPAQLPCPERACTGEACFVDVLQPALWGCGSCGSTWPELAALEADIGAAIARYPWRAQAYTHDGRHYRAAVPLPARYADEVALEWPA